jgi:hypothetical protein
MMHFSTKSLRGRIQLAILFLTAGIASLPALLATDAPRAQGAPLLRGAQGPAPVLATLQRACQNCHSENTAWPWYSKLPVVSARIHGDVAQARAFMDLSKWGEYSDQHKRGLLTAIASAAQQHDMPPRGYRMMHPEARLSDAEFSAIQSWAQAEQQRLRDSGSLRAH